MNNKIFSLMLALPLLLTDTGYSFADSSNLEMFYFQIPDFSREATVVTSYFNRAQPALLARGGYRPKCRRTGTGCR